MSYTLDEILNILKPPVANILNHKVIQCETGILGISSPSAQLPSSAVYGVLKYWDGDSWELVDLKVYVSGAFVQKPLYLWDGQNWRPLTAA